MRNHYDAIYLAPHLDDVALSCGAQIARMTRSGAKVLVVTIMAGDPKDGGVSDYVRSLHKRWGLVRDVMVQRRNEDIAACDILGADSLHLDVPDCIYRTYPATNSPIYLSDEAIFGPVADAETYLIDQLATQLATLPPAMQVIAPLTVGNHVDHVLVRQSAEQTFGAQRLWFYEDYPYAQTPGAVDSILRAEPDPWCAKVIAADEENLTTKIEAILAFRSQLSTFFSDRDDLERQVRSYAGQIGGERLWQCDTSQHS